MKVLKSTRRASGWTKHGQRVVLAAIGCVGLASSVCGAATTLFYDNNGTTSGFGSGTTSWNNLATDKHWATNAQGTVVGPWVPGSVAAIGTGTLQVSDV